jgi:CRP/FNR family transcriptional regulator
MVQEEKTLARKIQQLYPDLIEENLVEEILKVGKIFEFKAGEMVQEYGSYFKMVPLILEGSIKVVREDEDGHELFLYFLKPGMACSLAFACCRMDKKSAIRSMAEEDGMLIGVPIKYADLWISEHPSWKNFILRSYDYRVIELIHTIDSIAFRKMDERLMNYLEQKAEATDSHSLNATHQEIAYDLNASREAVSRLLKQLERQGIVKLGRNHIELIK